MSDLAGAIAVLIDQAEDAGDGRVARALRAVHDIARGQQPRKDMRWTDLLARYRYLTGDLRNEQTLAAWWLLVRRRHGRVAIAGTHGSGRPITYRFDDLRTMVLAFWLFDLGVDRRRWDAWFTASDGRSGGVLVDAGGDIGWYRTQDAAAAIRHAESFVAVPLPEDTADA